MAIRIQQYNTPPRRVQAGGIDPGFSNPLIRDAGRNGTVDVVDAMLKAGMQITEVGIREYVKDQTTAVSEALQEYRAALSTERDRYTKENKGKDAIGAGAYFDGFARDAARPLADRFSGRFREMFMKDAAATGLHFAEQGQNYGRQQKEAWDKSVFEGDMAQTMDAIANDPGNADFVEESLRNLKSRAASMFPGLDRRAMEADLNRKVAGLTIDSFLAKDNVGNARGAFSQYKDLLGAAAPQYEARIKAKGRELEARARAEQERAETQRALGSVASLLQDTAGMPQDKRESAIMDAIAQEPDIKRRQRMASVAMGELAFQARRLDAQNAAAGRALAEKVKDMSPLERSAYFQENGGSQEAINNAVKILSTGMMTDPVAMSQAKSAIAAGEDVDEVLAKYPTTINARDAEELRSFSADKARKSAHSRLTAWFDEMALKSGLDKKNDEDAQFLAESKTVWIEMIENGAFKTVEDQKNWIWERLAKRVNPGGWLGIWDQSVSPRKARDKADAYIPEVPPWEAEDIRRQLVRDRGVSNPTPKQIQEVYDAQRKQGQGRSKEITPLTPIYW